MSGASGPGPAAGSQPPAAPAAGTGLRVGYMTGQYPRATDTFIQREVAALRQRGVFVQTFSVRRPVDKEIVGPEQQAERDRTFYVLPAKLTALFSAHVKLLAASPRRYLCALKTAMTIRPPGLKALVWHAAYFAEAGVVADRVRAMRLSHLHNHFADSSCSVTLLAAELGGFTYSFTVHGPAEFYEPRFWRLDEKVRRARFVVCISQFCRSQTMVFSPRSCWEKCHIVHCGVDPADFAPAAPPPPAAPPEPAAPPAPAGADGGADGARLLFVGRLAAVKGMPILLEAVALLRRERPQVRLRVAGDGPDREALQEQAQQLGVGANVQFLGYQSQRQVRELLKQTDVFVMASFAEGVPVVLMEAMACGVPVVATQIAGVPELVEDGVSGFLVPPADPRLLAAKVEQLLQDPSLRRSCGERGRQKVLREFNIFTEADRLCTILIGAVGEPAQQRPAPGPAGSATRSESTSSPGDGAGAKPRTLELV